MPLTPLWPLGSDELVAGVLLDDAGDPGRQGAGHPRPVSAALAVHGLGPGQRVKLAPVVGPLAARPPDRVVEVRADAGVGHPPGVGGLGRVGGGGIVPAAGQSGVLTRLPGHSPAVPPPRMVHHKPEWHAVAGLDAVAPARAEVVAAGEGLLPLGLLLLLLYLCDLIIPLVLRIELVHILVAAQEALDLVQWPPGRDFLDLLDVAVAMDGVLGVGAAPAAAVEAVGVGRSLAVAEVARVSAPPDAPGHSALLDRLADHDAVLLELLGQDGVEEGVAAAVKRQHEHSEHLGRLQRYQLGAASCGHREESDGEPTNKVGEDKKRHPFGYLTVVRVPCLGASNSTIHLQIAAH